MVMFHTWLLHMLTAASLWREIQYKAKLNCRWLRLWLKSYMHLDFDPAVSPWVLASRIAYTMRNSEIKVPMCKLE